MNEKPRNLLQRSVGWLKSPNSHKKYSIVKMLLSRLNRSTDESIRAAIFHAMDSRDVFCVAGRGDEKYVVLNKDNGISKVLFVHGSFDFDKVEKAIAVIKSVNPGFNLEVLVDVGANIGTVCIPAIKRGLTMHAIAIEPEPLNYRMLMANIYLNDVAGKVITHNLAFDAEGGRSLEIELSSANSGDHRVRVGNVAPRGVELERAAVSVRSETFDSIVPRVDKNAFLVWMDTQGFEGFILQGATQAIRSGVPMVIEFWPEGMRQMGSYDALRSAIMSYHSYFDLNEDAPSAVPVTEASIDLLHAQLLTGGTWTDILLI